MGHLLHKNLDQFNGRAFISSSFICTYPYFNTISCTFRESLAKVGWSVKFTAGASSSTVLSIPELITRTEYTIWHPITRFTKVVLSNIWRSRIARLCIARTIINSKCPNVLLHSSMCDDHSINIRVLYSSVPICIVGLKSIS